jgi:hypothetical protein
MSRQPHSRERICEALESCRPGSNDLFAPELCDVADRVAGDPEWEETYERIQNADLKISAAFHDVEIPVGLEQRLIASLNIVRAGEAVSAALEVDSELDAPPVAPAVIPVAKPRILSRRRLLWSGGILSGAAVMLVAAFLAMNRSPGDSEQTVLDAAKQYFDADVPAAPGQLLSPTRAPRGFPLSNNIRHVGKIRWRVVNDFMGHEAVAFDLPAQGGARATLYAVDISAANLGTAPPSNPSNTGGCCVAAWREKGLVYVLVVQGTPETYRQYLNQPATMA